MFRLHYAALLLLLISTCVGALASTSPQEVSVCDLISNAKSYNGQLVQVRGNVTLAFEDFGISDPECQSHWSPQATFTPIWLTYGGDTADNAVYCCGSHARKKGTVLQIEGHKMPLVRDAAFQKFRNGLEAARLRRPDGDACYDECKFYRVAATITGTFFAATETPKSFSGYGHMGCCHLLVIQKVSNVRVSRTDVPIGEKFQCTSDSWKPGPEEAEKLQILHDCPQAEGCEAYKEAGLIQIASHWNDNINPKNAGTLNQIVDVNGSLITDWISSDLLTHYVSRSASRDDGIAATITQTKCHYGSLDHAEHRLKIVSCSHQELSPLQNEALSEEWERLMDKNRLAEATKKFAASAKQIFADGDQSWRFLAPKDAANYVLNTQTKKWKLLPATGLQFDSCTDTTVDATQTGQIVACGWFSRDGLQSFYVALLKYTGAEIAPDDRNTPWMVSSMDAHVCSVH